MQRAYKYLIAGLAIGLIVAAVGTYAFTSGQKGNGLALDCSQCHAEGHGSVIAPDVNMNGTILLTGDTPQDEYVVIDSIFRLKQKDIQTLQSQKDEGVPSRGVPVLDFLKAHNVSQFDALVIYADDFELVLSRDDVNDNTVFVPMEYSVRVLGDNMPIATWLKGIRAIVVVGGGAGDTIKVGDRTVSYGQMLDHGLETMPISVRTLGYEFRNTTYRYETGFLATGISLKNLLFRNGLTDFTSVSVDGVSISRNGVLGGSYFITRDNGTIKLATADQVRAKWPVISSITVA